MYILNILEPSRVKDFKQKHISTKSPPLFVFSIHFSHAITAFSNLTGVIVNSILSICFVLLLISFLQCCHYVWFCHSSVAIMTGFVYMCVRFITEQNLPPYCFYIRQLFI
uniref:Uncharacterized protein n=1 Tax=Cacopsylla melanoneura TaxID=428564 RepID=A0A8D9A349_9HEMI